MSFASKLSLRVNEIFYSIQGEGSFSGRKCLFVRLTGCPLRCRWCDTEYAFYEGRRLTFTEIRHELSLYPCKLVEVTGGEPLIQKNVYPFFEFLHNFNYEILLETSGAISVAKVPSYVHIVMDLKPPHSGESHKNCMDNLQLLKPSDDLKFVIAHEEDFYWAESLVAEKNLTKRFRNPPIVQPAHPDFPPEKLADLVKKSPVDFRLGLQLHKYIYPLASRGV
ncbi:MAG: radical SAM protein [Leptospiraceae bacterium]|nr:radical SAM protein [Leptospiraceae bacterium]MDW8307701.1 radical SAM protein [Leptospiraceae bacterium]